LTHPTYSLIATGRDQPLRAVRAVKPKFAQDVTGFSAELRRRVAGYFDDGPRGRDRWQMYLKTVVILFWLTGAYAVLVFAAATWWQAIPLALLLAGAMATVGFNIGHDGSHAACSRFPWVNRLAAASLDLIGASSYLWKWKHVVLHHTYPNVDGHDTDIDAGVVARLSPHQTRLWHHRWQHLYLWLAYGLTAVRWHLFGDFKEAAVGKIGPHRIPRPTGWDLAGLLLGKTVSIGLLIGLPMLWHPWWIVLTFYFLVACSTGFFLTVVFQLAHCVGEAHFPVPDPGTDRLSDAWAIHQVQTTVDFARTSRILTWLLGGLNFQVEHHLFPKIGHGHYPAVSRIVEDVCGEYGVPYTTHSTFWGGIVSHYQWLKRMGRPNQVPT
jgi:linoleoyl-CoA desaturase